MPSRSLNLVFNGKDKVSGPLGRIEHRLNGFVTTASRVAAALGAAFSAREIVQFGRMQLDMMDTAGKTADRLGMQVERLVELRHAATLAGIANNTLEQAVQRSTRRISEAAQGGGEAVSALAELRLNARELAAMSPDQQLAKIADALRGVREQGDRVRIAMRLFDSEGVQLLNLLQNGSGAMREASRDARLLGMTFSREAAAGAERFNDQISRMRASLQSFGRSLIELPAPLITWYAETATNALLDGDERFRESIKGLDGQSEAVARLTERITFLNKTLRDNASLDNAFMGIQSGMLTSERRQKVEAELATLQRDLRVVLQLEGRVREAAQRQTEREQAIRDALPGFTAGLAKMRDRIAEFGTEAGKTYAERFADAFNLGPGNKRLAGLAVHLREITRTPLDDFRKAMQEIDETFRAGFINQETAQRAVRFYFKQYRDASEEEGRQYLQPVGTVEQSRFGTGVQSMQQESLHLQQARQLAEAHRQRDERRDELLQRLVASVESGQLILPADIGAK